MTPKPTDGDEVGHAITDAALVSALTGLNSLLPRFVEALENVATKDEVAASRRTSLRNAVLIAVVVIVLVLGIIAADALYTRSTYNTIKGVTGKGAQEQQALIFKCFLQQQRYQSQLDSQGVVQLLLNDARVARGQSPTVVALPATPPDANCAEILSRLFGVTGSSAPRTPGGGPVTTSPTTSGDAAAPVSGPTGPRGAPGATGAPGRSGGGSGGGSGGSPPTTRPPASPTTTTTRPSNNQTCVSTPLAETCVGPR